MAHLSLLTATLLKILIVSVLSGLKTNSAVALGRVARTVTTQKQATQKSCLPAGIQPAGFGLPVHTGPQRTGNPKPAGSIPAGRQLFRVACF